LEKKPQGHGYTVLEVCRPNPFFAQGERIKGHEFHYSKANILKKEELKFAFRMLRGEGIFESWDGVTKKNTLATYTHIHALGNSRWADSFVRSALYYSRSKFFKEST
jgi:cobyrinic acid a,c-diamide synthase